MAAVIFALPWLGSVLWVARDHRVTAERYGDDFIGPTNTHWVFGSLFRWPVFFPWYLVMRHRQRQSRPGPAAPPQDYSDEDGVPWHRSPDGWWFYWDVATGWTKAPWVTDAEESD